MADRWGNSPGHCRFCYALVIMLRAFRLVPLLLLVMSITGCYSTKVPDRGISSSSRSGAVAAADSRRSGVYTVRANDTLYSIGKRFGVDYRQLARRNHIRPPYKIYIGQHLYLTGYPPHSRSLPVKTKAPRQPKKRRRLPSQRSPQQNPVTKPGLEVIPAAS